MTTTELIREAEASFQKSFDHLHTELAGLQIGRANAGLVENLQVEVYGSHQPLKNIASISIPDAKSIAIQPYDASTLTTVEKAIRESPLSLNPNNNGSRIILNIPPLTEERRRDLTKVVGQLAEEAKVSVRRARQDGINTAKRIAKEGEITEDEARVFEKHLQEKVDLVNKKIEDAAKAKEAEMLKI